MKENKPLLWEADHPFRNESRCYLPCRYVLALLSCCGFCVVYMLRVNLSVALVAMVNSTYANEGGVTTNNPECQSNTSKSSVPVDGKFNWDQKTQGLILGSFFYGYIITQVPGGWLASRFGGKYLFGFGVLVTVVLTICTPAAANHSVAMVIIVRILEGLGEGVTFPAMHAMWSRWAPPLERSKLVTFSYAGLQLGTILGMPLAGVLCASNIAGGWPSVFYIFGGVGVVWFILWMLITHDRPSNHPRISDGEKQYIVLSIGAAQDSRERTFATPWRDIWLSPAVWAIIVAHFCNNWGFYTFLTCLPTYFKEVLNFPIAQNGVLSAIPFACQYVIGIGAGQVADWLRQSNTLTTEQTRKVFCTGGFLIPACLMVSTSYMGCNDKSGIVVLFSLALGFAALNMASYTINHLDISPRFAGVLMGITNTAATIPGIVGPYVVGILTNNQPTRAQWQIVFYISAGIYVLGAVTYLLFGSGKVQPWNTPYEDLLVPIAIPRESRKCAMAHNLEETPINSGNEL